MKAAPFPTRAAAVLAVLIAAAGCSRGADEEQLRADLQARLDQGVKPDLFTVVGLRREGSAPLPAGESGAPRVVVYFNTTLQLEEDYGFGAWDQLGASSVAFALGASEKGVFGLQPQNAAGDLVRAYGSAIYEQTAEGWIPIAAAPAGAVATAPDFDGTAPPSRSKQLIDRLAAMVELPPPGVPPQQDEIIADELARASENIERRVRRREHTFTMASGPADGEYARVTTAIIAAVNQLAPGVSLRQRHTEGSIENAWLVARGEADYAIVQGDVAAAAIAGHDMFARGGSLTTLRAVGGLFPEPIHIVVRRDSPIQDVAGLRGRRVNIGTPASGTQYDATAVLAAYGLTRGDLAEARQDGVADAIRRLQRRQIDALFVTAAAPTRALQQLAVQTGLRLLPVTGGAMERLIQERPGLTPLVLPANTYPEQKEAVATVASAALLITTADAPETEVERLADLVFSRMPQQRAGSAGVLKVSAENELRGVTIPLHPGAARRTPAATVGRE
jgi:TRAP transporter TAXI family solute receptor